jgi:HlyD family secretion protein
MRRSVVLLPLAAVIGCHSPEESRTRPVVEVKVLRVEAGDVPLVVRAPATIFARAQADVAPQISATVRELKAGKGDRVEAGQLLARLESRDLVAQRAEAAAAVEDAEATLEKVTAGTLPAEIERARGQVATAEAALRQAQKFYERRKRLFEQGAIPNRDLVVSETELAQARTNYEVAVKALELLVGQSKDREIRIARSRLEQARGRLAQVEAQLSFAEVRSPFAGLITEQYLFPGDIARPGTPIFRVADISVAVARAQVPEAEAASLRRGQPCAFTPLDGAGASFRGALSVVNQAVDPSRRTIEVWCEIPNRNHALRVAAYGHLDVVTGRLEKAIALPPEAVQVEEGGERGVVMVAGDGRKAVRREVVLGARSQGLVEIRRGLRPGELVIVEGGYGLPEGTEIRWP